MIAALALPPLAFAQNAADAQAMAQKIADFLGKQGGTYSWDAVDGTASDFVVKGLKQKRAKDGQTVSYGDVTLSGVTETDGAITIGAAKVPQIDAPPQDGMNGAVKDISFTNLTLSEDPLVAMRSGLGIQVASFFLEGEADKIRKMNMENFSFNMTALKPDQPFTIKYDMPTLMVDTDQFPMEDPKARDALKEFGLSKLNMSMAFAADWQPAGKARIETFSLNLKDAGAFTFTGEIDGLTWDVIQELQAIDRAEMGGAGVEKRREEIARKIIIKSATLRYDDASLTSKALAMAGEQQNVDPALLKDQVKAMVPFALAQTKVISGELLQKIGQASSAFLDNPKNLVITIKPAQPKSLADLAIAVAANPATAATELGLDVQANQ